MSISLSSRYNLSIVDYIQVEKKGSVTPIVFYVPDDLREAKFRKHVVRQGDSLLKLSWEYYDRPDLWWAIAEYNPEIVNFISLTPGKTIRIPVV